ncbi:MAG: DUF3472 domain-containing protein [Bacteroidales bacterium]|nr:DUF3472 domain-containing protein [Bacteroidales bacterium]
MKRIVISFSLVAAVILTAASCSSRVADFSNEPCRTVPFAGNVFVTAADGNLMDAARSTIHTQKGIVTDWNNPSTRLSFYFRANVSGTFKLGVNAWLPEGTKSSELRFSCNEVSRKVRIAQGESRFYPVGEFSVKEPGYVRVDISGMASPANAQFARIGDFVLGGPVAQDSINCTTRETVADCYWFRRGPSVHFNYTLPDEDVEWFYNEVLVPEGKDVESTYYMLTGFKEGYMGIQTHGENPNNVLFSVWSPFATDNPQDIPENMKVTTLRRGENVRVNDFGGEGSGGQSFLDYDWKPGQIYKTLVHVRPTGTGSTDYTGYFCDERGNWHLVASFRRPHTNVYYTKAHSFLECFEPETSIFTREVQFRNQWAYTAKGQWVEVTQARFTCDNTGRIGARTDKRGTMADGAFVLGNCGFFDESTSYGTVFTRDAHGQAPTIDFGALEKTR